MFNLSKIVYVPVSWLYVASLSALRMSKVSIKKDKSAVDILVGFTTLIITTN